MMQLLNLLNYIQYVRTNLLVIEYNSNRRIILNKFLVTFNIYCNCSEVTFGVGTIYYTFIVVFLFVYGTRRKERAVQMRGWKEDQTAFTSIY